MLTIWSKDPPSKIYSKLSPVTKHHASLPMEITADPVVTDQTRLVLALGGDALKHLQGFGVVAKNKTVTSLRNAIHQYKPPGAKIFPVMVSYNPAIGDIDHGYYVDLLCDMASAIRFYNTGTLNPNMGVYRWVPQFEEFIAKVEAKYIETGKPVDCTLDLETTGFDMYRLPDPTHPGAYIVSVALSCEYGKSDAVYFTSREDEIAGLKGLIGQQIASVITNPHIKLKGANLKFDLHWLWVRLGPIRCTNFVFDTTLVGGLLDENRSNGLDVHTKIYVPNMGGYSDEFDLHVDKSRMDLVPKEILLPYAGGDTDACLQVSDVLKGELLKDPALTKFYLNILHPAARAFEVLEQGGVYVDRDRYEDLRCQLEAAMKIGMARIKKCLGGRLVAKHYDHEKTDGLNPMKASLIVDYMFTPNGLNLKPKMMTEKSDLPSTAMEHLEMFADLPEAKEYVAAMKEFGSAQKTLNTYYTGFLTHLRSDGKFHPTYFLFAGDKAKDEGGTVTGRLSAKAPAFQTIPKHSIWGKILRQVFIAPPGYLVMERDYSQGELRVIACIANELAMIEAYRNNRDLHTETAGPFRGYTYDQMMALKKTDKDLFDAIRQLGKAGNFGLIYGMKEAGFQAYAQGNYGVAMSMKEATEFRTSFFARYPRLISYHEAYQAYAMKHGFVRGPLGRLRHLPLMRSPNQEFASKALRQAINSPVQGTLSDMLLWSMALEYEAGISVIAPAFGSVHDATYNYVPEDKADILVPQFLDIQQNLPFHKLGWHPQLQFLADAKLGKSMGSLKEYKQAA